MTSVSTSSGEAPGSVVRTVTRRQVDRREAIDAEPEVGGRADHDQREDEHRREDRPADADFGELLHDLGLDAHRRTAGEVAGIDDHRLAPLEPVDDLDVLAERRPVCTRTSAVLPLRTISTFSTPAK